MTLENRSALLNDLINLRAIVEQQLGAGNINLIYVLRPIAEQQVALGLFEDAEPVQRTILAMCEKRPGNPVLPSLYDARKALAATLISLGQSKEAIPLLKACQVDDVKAGGSMSKTWLATASSLVRCLEAAESFDDATALLTEIVASMDEAPADFTAGVRVSFIIQLSNCFAKQGKYAEAAQIAERTLPIWEAHNEVLCIPQLDSLAELYRKAGDTEAYTRTRESRRLLAVKHNH